MYKINDLVAIPAADYLIPNTRQSRHNHQLAYRQIPTLKDYYKFTFFRHTIVHLNTIPFYIPFFTYCGPIQSCCVPSSTHLTVDISAFDYTNLSPSLAYFFLTIHLFLAHLSRRLTR